MNRRLFLCFFFLDHPVNALARKFKIDVIGYPYRKHIIVDVPDQAVNTTDGDHPIAFLKTAQELLPFFLVLLLRPDQQEIKDHEKENQW